MNNSDACDSGQNSVVNEFIQIAACLFDGLSQQQDFRIHHQTPFHGQPVLLASGSGSVSALRFAGRISHGFGMAQSIGRNTDSHGFTLQNIITAVVRPFDHLADNAEGRRTVMPADLDFFLCQSLPGCMERRVTDLLLNPAGRFGFSRASVANKCFAPSYLLVAIVGFPPSSLRFPVGRHHINTRLGRAFHNLPALSASWSRNILCCVVLQPPDHEVFWPQLQTPGFRAAFFHIGDQFLKMHLLFRNQRSSMLNDCRLQAETL